MQCGHEQLDVYGISIRYVSRAYEVAEGLEGVDRHARDQLVCASQFVPLKLAEGKILLTGIASMQTKLGQRSYEMREGSCAYGGFDYDNDNEFQKRG